GDCVLRLARAPSALVQSMEDDASLCSATPSFMVTRSNSTTASELSSKGGLAMSKSSILASGATAWTKLTSVGMNRDASFIPASLFLDSEPKISSVTSTWYGRSSIHKPAYH